MMMGNTIVGGIDETLSPQLKHLEQQYKELSAQFTNTQAQIQPAIATFNRSNDQYKTFVGLCGTLAMNVACGGFSNDQFNQFLQLTQSTPPSVNNSNMLFNSETTPIIQQQYAEMSPHLMNACYCTDTLQERGFFNQSSGALAVSQDIFNGLMTGVQIIASFGNIAGNIVAKVALAAIEVLDPFILLAEIKQKVEQYQRANGEIMQRIFEMQSDLNQINSTTSEIEQRIREIKQTFLNLCNQLNQISPTNFNWQFGVDGDDASFMNAMTAAASQYSILSLLRYHWTNYVAKHPDGTLAVFEQEFTDVMVPNRYTPEIVHQYLTVLLQYNPSMAQYKPS